MDGNDLKVYHFYFKLIFLSFFITQNLTSQKSDYVWIMGVDDGSAPGVQAFQFDFNHGTRIIKSRDIPYGFDNTNSSFCNANGELLFYTNGCAIINRNNQVLPNGEFINEDQFKEVLNWDNCRYGYPGIQNSMIIPDPKIDSCYYLIHKTNKLSTISNQVFSELRNSYIDMRLASGYGDVVYLDSVIDERKMLSSYLDMLPHINGRDWWMIQPIANDSIFATFLISENGIETKEDQSSAVYFRRDYSSSTGNGRFSPDGKQYALYNYYDNLHLYDFDRETGKLYNHRHIKINENIDYERQLICPIEWSPNGRFIYITNFDSLFQVDLHEDDIGQSKKLIDTYDGTQNPFPANFYTMNLAPDCKIYISSTNSVRSIHVIENPDGLGSDCSFKQNGVQLPGITGIGNIPIFPRYRVDASNICDSTITKVYEQVEISSEEITMYPNPARNVINLFLPNIIKNTRYEIYNILGEKIMDGLFNDQNVRQQINISNLYSGTYYLKISSLNKPDQMLFVAPIVVLR